MKIAVVIVHNKTDQQNQAQIDAILPFVEKITVPVTQTVQDRTLTEIPHQSEFGYIYHETVETLSEPYEVTVETYHYKVKGLNIDHEVKFYQIIPFGVTPPSNKDALDSYKVYYGEGDEDKTGNHPRFFNWGLKRGTDFGADIVVYLDDVLQLTTTKLRNGLGKLRNDVEFVEETFGKIGTKRLLEKVGQLKEDRTFTQAITEYKQRVTQGGLKNG